ncbi:MAG TPA: D-alanyl-D-alanine carboxypeptidase/D-alanyl-D-alanine-endopeptidase [Terriglobales bacterium]|jgi:N-acyl-D-amino-acid deacylase|nr:D-alanyl-D-alanine carboxypeptidase/D-alanyl-D-alanine-endopeptidase [Terriglobales bacterium]
MKMLRYSLAFFFVCWSANAVFSQAATTLPDRIQAIMSRPAFAHSSFGIAFYSLDTGKTLYEVNADKLMVPGSTTKLLTEGSLLELLGGDYRFHTRVYRTGPINKDGTLDGDIVVIASGDPNLSGRIQPDGTLGYENTDHSYGGPDSKGVGDPLEVLRELADQIANKGIKRLKGRVLVDVSLFPEGERELGTNVVVSPIVVNDNVIDVIVSPGDKEGAPVNLQISPKTAYLQIINQATTATPSLNYTAEKLNPDGTRSVTLMGAFPAGKAPRMMAYAVPEPSRFAATVLAEALKQKGVELAIATSAASPDFKALAANYKPENLIAEHTSLPLKEDVKITLKLSQNLHATMGPFLLGALVAHKDKEIDQAGFTLEQDFLKKANLDLTAASQTDGAGGNAFFTADFMVHYLTFMTTQKDFADFHRGLPILGRDGTLFKIQTHSPASGHVEAKTGTYAVYDALNKNLMVTGKGLAGYIQTASGQHLAFAAYINMVSVPLDDPEATQKIAGEALGEIAAAGYDAPLNSADTSAPDASYDVIIRNGRIIDGSGNPWVSGDVAIRGDRIVAIGRLEHATAKRVIDASGLIVSPGFIDMLGQSEWSLLIDNRSLSKLSQGITTEITGEGGSVAPQDALTIPQMQADLDQYHVKIDWSTLKEYFARLEKTRTPLNIGTYVGAAQVREAVLGDVDRAPTLDELAKMQTLVAQAMQQGAFGISTALIYPPGHYAKTEELIELAKTASQYGGIYATHMRSEGRSEVPAIEEALRIGREAHLPVEIFHLKVVGQPRWGSMPKIVAMIQSARDAGQDVSADMYPYVAGGTALASSLPPWVADGGMEKLLNRLTDTTTRAKIKQEMATEHDNWENLYLGSGGASGVLISGIVNPDLKKYDGQTLAQIANAQKKAPLDALFDLVLADKAQTGAIYFIANEDDVRYGLKQPWTSVGLDAGELSLDGSLYEPHSHPRAFGTMPRLLGHYVRDEQLLPLEQAIRKITSLPAQREGLRDRGLIREDYFADITIFDPATIRDHATYENPTQLSEGIKYVFVNGQLEYEDGHLTQTQAGKVLHGPGWDGAH